MTYFYFLFLTGNESMLYFSTYPYTDVQLFSPELGPFESNSFVMAHEYMFVQVMFIDNVSLLIKIVDMCIQRKHMRSA